MQAKDKVFFAEMARESHDYRPDIDGLRTVAVLSVLFYHLGVAPVTGGYIGVDVFFVISGYLISRKIVADVEANRFSFRSFYLARVRRILPALLATVAITFAASALVLSPGVFQELARSSIAAVFSVSNILFWTISGYFDSDSTLKPLLHTWSLGVEEQFYLFWPMLVVGVFRFGKRIAGLVVVLAAALSLIAAQIALSADASAAFFLLPFRIWELAIGAALLWLPQRRSTPNFVAELGMVAGLAMIAAAATSFNKTSPFPGLYAVLPCAGAALAIQSGGARYSSRLLTNPVSVWIGKISYSLYLVHWPLIILTKYVLMRDLRPVEQAVLFALSIALAQAMYAFVEQPFRARRKNEFAVKPKALLASVAIAAVIVVAPALNAWSSAGWTWRLGRKAAIVEGVSNPRKFHTEYYGGAGCKLPRCETTPGAPRKAYVIGDSHARALYAGLAASFPDVNFIIFGPDSCPLYTIRFGLHRDPHAKACQRTRKLAFAEIAAGDAPVFMMQHWAARWKSEHFNVNGEGPALKLRSRRKFARFVSDELAGVKALIGAQPLTVIGGWPRYDAPSSPLDCISRPLQQTACDTSDLSTPVIAEQRRLNRLLSAAIDGRFRLIDPYDYLCDEKRCRNFDSAHQPIYSDRTHLSSWGSEFLVAAMKPDLDAAMAEPTGGS